MFAYLSERLTYRLRQRLLNSIIHEDMEYFDDPDNSTGSICSIISKETQNIQMVIN